MSEKRFYISGICASRQIRIVDSETGIISVVDVYDDTIQYFINKLNEQQATISKLEEENEQLRRLFEEMKRPTTINLTEEDEKELRKLLGLIDDE